MPDISKNTAPTPGEAKPAKQSTRQADPVPALIAALSTDNEVARKQARGEFSGIAAGGRPWEQLPSDLKSAARADARDLVTAARDAGGDKAAAIVDAGYHPFAASRLLQDIGAV